MAKLSKNEILHIAKLSKLDLREDEIELYSSQLSSVLSYMEQLGEVDTEGVEPTANVTGLKNIFRRDLVTESGIGHKEIEENAPEFRDGHFIVPGVFE